MIFLYIFLSLCIGYLFGAFPTGVVLIRLLKRKNIRELGNKRPGAANIFREISPAWGIAVGLLDSVKAYAGVLAVILLGFPEYTFISASIAIMIGHNWSVFLRFKGGEGVAVSMGISVLFYPGVWGILIGVYFLFLLFWALHIRPFYRYHMFNWQSVFFCAPLILWICGKGWITEYSGISFETALLLSGVIALTGLLKQIELYGFTFLFKPSNFRNKYVKGD